MASIELPDEDWELILKNLMVAKDCQSDQTNEWGHLDYLIGLIVQDAKLDRRKLEDELEAGR